MTEFIGARISLISKSDIRYVGTLVEINSADSTVALENVRSFGTEDRRTGADFYPASDSAYEYILFRGSDVKDLRVESRPNEPQQPPEPQMPADPAILGSARPPNASTPAQQNAPPAPQGGPQPPPYNQYGGFGGPPPPGFGRGGFPGPYQGGPGFGPYPGGPGMQGMPFPHHGHAPPGPHGNWYGGPPPQGFPPGQFGHPPPGMPGGPPQQAPGPVKDDRPVEKDTDTKAPEPPKAAPPTGPAAGAKKGPPPPVESKPDVSTALAPPAPAEPKSFAAAAAAASSSKPKAGAVPRHASTKTTSAQAEAPKTSNQTPAEAAAAAVAAAMAKLPGVAAKPPQVTQAQKSAGDNLSQKINEMRIDDQVRHPHGGAPRGPNRGRGRGRGGPRGVVVPNTDFDFESANKKFNKEELAKEVDPGVAETLETESEANGDVSDDVIIPTQPVIYDKKKSFFDNISSEQKDREEKKSVGGSEFRHEERKRNIETFGQGSVDGYRGGYRGGRGRGRGAPRGRGGYGMNRGRGGVRGGFGTTNQATAQ